MTPYLTRLRRPRRFFPAALTAIAMLSGYAVGVAQSATNATPSDRVALRYDQEKAELLVIVDEKVIAQFSAAGLAVEGDITFTGSLLDQGRDDDAQAD